MNVECVLFQTALQQIPGKTDRQRNCNQYSYKMFAIEPRVPKSKVPELDRRKHKGGETEGPRNVSFLLKALYGERKYILAEVGINATFNFLF